VDYPGEISLKQIYGTFNRAMLKKFNSIKSYADALTNAMVEFFLMTQVRLQEFFLFEDEMIYLGAIYC
jgi:dynein heavy chain 1